MDGSRGGKGMKKSRRVEGGQKDKIVRRIVVGEEEEENERKVGKRVGEGEEMAQK